MSQLRLYLSTTCFTGSYTKFTKLCDAQHTQEGEKEDEGAHFYQLFCNKSLGLGLVVKTPNPDCKRVLPIVPLDQTKAEILGALDGQYYGVLKFQEKTVADCLAAALDLHDKCFPDMCQSYAQFILEDNVLGEGQWTLFIEDMVFPKTKKSTKEQEGFTEDGTNAQDRSQKKNKNAK